MSAGGAGARAGFLVYRRGKASAQEGMRGGVITECAGLGGGERSGYRVRWCAAAGCRWGVIALCSDCRVL